MVAESAGAKALRRAAERAQRQAELDSAFTVIERLLGFPMVLATLEWGHGLSHACACISRLMINSIGSDSAILGPRLAAEKAAYEKELAAKLGKGSPGAFRLPTSNIMKHAPWQEDVASPQLLLVLRWRRLPIVK